MADIVATCARSETLSGSTRITLTKEEGSWSRVLYVKGHRTVPAGCEVRAHATKATAKSSRSRYWNAIELELTVNHEFVRALMVEHVGWGAARLMDELEEEHPGVLNLSGVEYCKAWIEHAKSLVPGSVYDHVRARLMVETRSLFVAQFRELLAARGVPEAEAAALAGRLDLDARAAALPEALCVRWLEKPCSPHLPCLSEATRRALCDDLGVRARREAHLELLAAEQAGATHVGLGGRDSETLGVDDGYAPLPSCRKETVRPAQLSVWHDAVQHTDVADCEARLVEHWAPAAGARPGLEPDCPGGNSGQRRALAGLFAHRLSAVTGGPGRGKTWLGTHLCALWRKHTGGDVVVVSAYHQPLKNMAKHMADSVAKGAKAPLEFRTIASLVTSGPPRVAKPCLVIVEEAGVCTVPDLCAAFDAFPEATVVMMGDDRQLKPIGPGQPFADFIRLHPARSVRLVENMRTSSKCIQANVAAVDSGDPVMQTGPDFEWREAPCFSERTAELFVAEHMADFDLERDVALVFTNALRKLINAALLARRNEGRASGGWFKGTRIICTETTAGKKVTNGTRGTVSFCKGDRVMVTTDSGSVETPRRVWDLAYALTAHRAQGSEYETVFVYSYDDERIARDWLYTCISRARSRVVYLVPPKQHARVVARAPRESASLIAQRTSRPAHKRVKT
jgi:hypothetical protein